VPSLPFSPNLSADWKITVNSQFGSIKPGLNVKINEIFSPLFFIVFILRLLWYG
jgi:hypothetical protein